MTHLDSRQCGDLSRCLSLVLRHQPWLFELELDEEGWAPLEEIAAGLRCYRPEWCEITVSDLAWLVSQPGKQRYEIRGDQIRALYGHSIPGKLLKTRAKPPPSLFHGTSPAALEAIRAHGILPMRRQFVHLSIDRDTAEQVGRRKAMSPTILEIRAAAAHEAGVAFYIANANVWLADFVPPEFLIAIDRCD